MGLTFRKLKSVTAYFLNLGRFVAGGVILPLGKWSDESEFLWASEDCEGAGKFQHKSFINPSISSNGFYVSIRAGTQSV